MQGFIWALRFAPISALDGARHQNGLDFEPLCCCITLSVHSSPPLLHICLFQGCLRSINLLLQVLLRLEPSVKVRTFRPSPLDVAQEPRILLLLAKLSAVFSDPAKKFEGRPSGKSAQSTTTAMIIRVRKCPRRSTFWTLRFCDSRQPCVAAALGYILQQRH